MIGLAVGTARSLHTDERLARIETGLLLSTNWKGEPRATMPLRDQMAHYQAPGVSLAVLDKGGLAAVRGWGVARGRRTLAGIAVVGDPTLLIHPFPAGKAGSSSCSILLRRELTSRCELGTRSDSLASWRRLGAA